MNTYETSARVEEQGQVRIVGVPFAPGTEVKISISEKAAPVPTAEAKKPEDCAGSYE